MAQAIALADAALWAAASRCQRGWESHVSWTRLDRVLTPEEREAAAVVGRKGRTLRTAWAETRRRAHRPIT
jgi:endonuclease/exonuclease/phosphatase family metal-dependent hydrolase